MYQNIFHPVHMFDVGVCTERAYSMFLENAIVIRLKPSKSDNDHMQISIKWREKCKVKTGCEVFCETGYENIICKVFVSPIKISGSFALDSYSNTHSPFIIPKCGHGILTFSLFMHLW